MARRTGNSYYNNQQNGYYNNQQGGTRSRQTNGYYNGQQGGPWNNGYQQNQNNSYLDSFRWNSGYSADYASENEVKPSKTAVILGWFNKINEKRSAKKRPPVRVKGSAVSYNSAEMIGGYKDYVFVESQSLDAEYLDVDDCAGTDSCEEL